MTYAFSAETKCTMGANTMRQVDGAKRKRRNRMDARAQFYAHYRMLRWRKRFFGISFDFADLGCKVVM